MTEMIEFTNSILSSIATFLGQEPIIYLFGLICFLVICKAVISVFQIKSW